MHRRLICWNCPRTQVSVCVLLGPWQLWHQLLNFILTLCLSSSNRPFLCSRCLFGQFISRLFLVWTEDTHTGKARGPALSYYCLYVLVRVPTCVIHSINVEARGQPCGVGLSFCLYVGPGDRSPVVTEPPYHPVFVCLFNFVWF